MGQAKKDHLGMPDAVQDAFGYRLDQAQMGLIPDGAIRLKESLRDVMEIRMNHEGDTYRMIFTTEFPDAVYVLHVFKKKSKRGLQTPREEIDRITERLKRVRTLNRSGPTQQ
jgi:phage-related protein